MAEDGMLDRITIRDLRVHGIVGIHDHERKTPQEIVISLTIWTDIRECAGSDDIQQTVNYHTVATQVTAHVQAAQRLTIEALATDIARICCGFDRVARVRVHVGKPDALADAATVGVQIERTPADFA